MDEVIIVGAGPAGAVAATILARAGARVRVFERARLPRHKLCGDTLNPGALRALADYIPMASLLQRGLPLDGMRLTGPGGIEVRGRYGVGLTGRSIARRELDAMLVEHAVAAGAQLDDEAVVDAPVIDGATGSVAGVTVKLGDGSSRAHRARLVIAADGRASRLARALKLSGHPVRPRRWAIGAYFEGVGDLTTAGEMHVRRGHYIGVAPMPDGLANACLVVPHRSGHRVIRDPAAALLSALRADPILAPRFDGAKLAQPVQMLGPMAVDARAAGVAGLLMAGDAAGFIDPMTGDGLRFAVAGAAFAAEVALDVLAGRVDPAAAGGRLECRRRAAFGRKWRFNRSLRTLVASPSAVSAAAAAALIWPAAFEAIIRYAGDCQVGVTTCNL